MFEVGDEVVLLVDRPGDNGMLHRGDTGVVCCVEHGFYGWAKIKPIVQVADALVVIV